MNWKSLNRHMFGSQFGVAELVTYHDNGTTATFSPVTVLGLVSQVKEDCEFTEIGDMDKASFSVIVKQEDFNYVEPLRHKLLTVRNKEFLINKMTNNAVSGTFKLEVIAQYE